MARYQEYRMDTGQSAGAGLEASILPLVADSEGTSRVEGTP